MKTISYDETQWKLVPIEPTGDMIRSGQNTICVTTDDDDADSINDYKSVYRSMIKAAPPYPEDENIMELLQQSKENFERNFCGNSLDADWIYSDLKELFSAYLPAAPKSK